MSLITAIKSIFSPGIYGSDAKSGNLNIAGSSATTDQDTSSVTINPNGGNLYINPTGSSNGNIGIGTNSPTAGNILSVNGISDFNGSVGIGTDSPAAGNILSVNGNTDFNGSVGIGTNSPISGNILSVNGNTDFNGKVVSVTTVGQYMANFIATTPGENQGEQSAYTLYSTFQETSDNAPRRTADIVAGFNNGAWGNEYLTLNVGQGGSSNDGQAVTTERMRITGYGVATTVPINLVATLNSSNNFQSTDCFSGNYSFYEIVFLGVTSSLANSLLSAHYYSNKIWLYGDGNANPNNCFYNTESWGNDIGGNSAASTWSDQNGNSQNWSGRLHIWQADKEGPEAPGVYGKMTVYNPQDGYGAYTALIYAPAAWNNRGCQIYTAGSYTGSEHQGAGAAVTGVRFFFTNDSTWQGTSSISSGTIKIYGYH